MQDGLSALDELEFEGFGAGRPGEQEGYMASEAYAGEGEFEDRYDGFDSGEGEFEDRYDGFDGGLGEFESRFDGFDSGEGEFESYLGEWEGEGDPFFGKIWQAAKKVGKVVAPLAKRFAPQIGSVIGGALGGPAGAAIGGKLGGFVQQLEAEDEGESEDEMNFVAPIPELEGQLAEAVALAASRGRPLDAQSLGSQITIFIGARAPIRVRTVLPVLSKASGDIARTLVAQRDPRARMLVRALPAIQRRTIATLTRKAQMGRPVTPRIATRVMAKHAQRTLANPQAISQALAQNAMRKRVLDRRAIASAERRR